MCLGFFFFFGYSVKRGNAIFDISLFFGTFRFRQLELMYVCRQKGGRATKGTVKGDRYCGGLDASLLCALYGMLQAATRELDREFGIFFPPLE